MEDIKMGYTSSELKWVIDRQDEAIHNLNISIMQKENERDAGFAEKEELLTKQKEEAWEERIELYNVMNDKIDRTKDDLKVAYQQYSNAKEKFLNYYVSDAGTRDKEVSGMIEGELNEIQSIIDTLSDYRQKAETTIEFFTKSIEESRTRIQEIDDHYNLFIYPQLTDLYRQRDNIQYQRDANWQEYQWKLNQGDQIY